MYFLCILIVLIVFLYHSCLRFVLLDKRAILVFFIIIIIMRVCVLDYFFVYMFDCECINVCLIVILMCLIVNV